MTDRYIANKYAGRTYCGNGFFDTFIECMQFGDDGFCDRIVINDTVDNRKYTIKITTEGVVKHD